jgi:hypothetical protein
MNLRDIEKVMGTELTVLEADALSKELNDYRQQKRQNVVQEIPSDELEKLRELVRYIHDLEDEEFSVVHDVPLKLSAMVHYDYGKINIDYWYSENLATITRLKLNESQVLALLPDIGNRFVIAQEKLKQLHEGVKQLANKYGIPHSPIWKLIDADNCVI